jgi:DNA-binding response OmpR family regulator
MPTVLAVDDSRSVRALVRKAFASEAIEVVQAEDGQVALDLLATTKVDVILLDVTMPRMDGITCLRALRARGDQTPVIMLTSESNSDVVASAHALGIADYMIKPFEAEALKAMVCGLLGLHRPAAEPATELAAS